MSTNKVTIGSRIIAAVASAFLIAAVCGCGNTSKDNAPPKSASMAIVTSNTSLDQTGSFDTTVMLNAKEYHITSVPLNYEPFTISINYTLTINEASVSYNTGDYYGISEVYLADLDSGDNSVIMFVLPIWENGYQNMTAYKYMPEKGIEQLSFDLNGKTTPVLEPGRRCSDFELAADGTFNLVTGTRSNGMWGLERRFRLDDNNVLTFEQQDKYKIRYWADGFCPLFQRNYANSEPTQLTFEEAKRYQDYGVETEKDYEMLLQGWYACKQSYGDLLAGDYYKIVYDDNNGHAMFVTSEGREGWIDVISLGSDQITRRRIGGFALTLAG